MEASDLFANVSGMSSWFYPFGLGGTHLMGHKLGLRPLFVTDVIQYLGGVN